MNHVAPLFRSRFRLPARRRAPGPHGFVCLPQARRGGQVDPDHEPPSFRRLNPPGSTTREPFASKACTCIRGIILIQSAPTEARPLVRALGSDLRHAPIEKNAPSDGPPL